MKTGKSIGLIPSRWGSTRFPGKPLALIAGKTMVRRVYERCTLCKDLDEVYVVTDSNKIMQECELNNMNVLFIDEECNTGTDRIALAAADLEADIFVNVQGDEPLIDPKAITSVITVLRNDPDTKASNAFTLIEKPYKVVDSDVVKVVFDEDDFAMYFSRSPIPNPKSNNSNFYQQLGLYAFRKDALEEFLKLDQGPLEKSEGVEMLRFIEKGYKLKMVEVNDIGLSVDSPKDLISIEEYLKADHKEL